MNDKKFTEGVSRNNSCLACGSVDLRILLDLGDQPLANSYHNGSEEQDRYPLKLVLCSKCHHLQQSHTVDPDLMFKNYLYVSGTTHTLRKYFEDFASKTLQYCPEAESVLDIACNDGSQLDSYKKLGIDTYGVDPAENLYKDSVSKGHNIICDYLTEEVALSMNKKFDIITAQNVFAHTSDPLGFLFSCKILMKDSTFLFIQTSQANMVVNNEFDTVYHEHISFFNTLSMKMLVERAGLFLVDVFKTDIHGTSYVFVIGKNSSYDQVDSSRVSDILAVEFSNGLHSMTKYGEYVSRCYESAFTLKEEIENLRKDGYVTIGYGAAAKGNTLLNFAEIKLDLIIDDNPLKQELLTPGQNIIIKPISVLDNYKNDKIAFVPLAWNFFEEIKSRVESVRFNSEDIFVKYFPKFEKIKEDTLTDLGIKHQTDKAIPHKFTEFYDDHLSKHRKKFLNVLEIGVFKNGSLRMWRDYFKNANVYGVDIDPASMLYEERIKTYLISQTDSDSLDHAFSNIKFDLIVDDASHITSHQINTFLHMRKKLNPGGYYIIEDLHTSFMPSFIDTEKTTIDFLKSIDYDEFNIHSIDFFHNMDEEAKVDCITSIIKFR